MKKILATVSAVVLSLAMVAMPSIAVADEVESTETPTTETVTTDTVTEPETTEPETTEPETTEPETTEPETTEPETTEPETTEGDTTGTDTVEGDPVLERTAFQTGELDILLDLELEVDGTATHQVCEESGDESVGTLVPGSIQLTISDLGGVEKIEYSKDGGTVYLVTSLPIQNLEPGKYDFVVTVMNGYEAVDDFSVTVKADKDPACKKQEICHWNEGGGGSYNLIDVSIKSIINVPNGHEYHENDIIPAFYYYKGDVQKYFPGLNLDLDVEGCGDGPDLPTEGPVIPEVVFTPGTCEADGSYQLISPAESADVPAGTVTWFVNDVETAAGTYPLAAGVEVTVKVVANFVDYPLDIEGDILTEYTYDPYSFAIPTDCALDTLALTGSSDTTPALALTAFLGLLGLAMVRSGIRVNRVRQEA
jgi:hypothetical protein